MRLIEFLLPILIVDVGLLVVLVEPQGKVCPTLTREEQIQGSIDPSGISSITCGSDLRLLCRWTINTTNCEYGVYYRLLYSNITGRICGQKIPTAEIVYNLTPSQTGRIVMTTTYTTGYVSGEAILIVKNFQSEDEGRYRCEIETNLLRRDVTVNVTCSEPVGGVKSAWGDWQPCSVTCGYGEQTRTRTCTPPMKGSKECDGKLEERTCYKRECVVGGVTSAWGDWGDWQPCSVTCGYGKQTRTRTCTPPMNGSKECDGKLEGRTCYKRECVVSTAPRWHSSVAMLPLLGMAATIHTWCDGVCRLVCV